MSKRPTKADVEAAYVRGAEWGRSQERLKFSREQLEDLETRRLESIIKLTNAVGQTLQAQANLIQGLASSLDELRGTR